jgi:4'-phosphopantetheinyl transferase
MPAAALTLIQRCDHCGGPHGRPRLLEVPGIFVSLSHSKGHVVVGASHGAVGVDVERLHVRAFDDGLRSTALAPAEAAIVATSADPTTAFLGFWVLKESLVKIGLLSLDRFTRIDLADLFAPPAAGVQSQLWQGVRLSMWCDGGAIIGQAQLGRSSSEAAGLRGSCC